MVPLTGWLFATACHQERANEDAHHQKGEMSFATIKMAGHRINL